MIRPHPIPYSQVVVEVSRLVDDSSRIIEGR